jgi:hypothetical protein
VSEQGAGAAVADPPLDPPTGPTPGPTVRLPIAVLAVLAALVVALLVVALVVRLDADRLPSGPPRDPPAGLPESKALTVSPDGTVRYQEFSLTLAGPPFRCGDVATPPPGFSAFVACDHVVHRNFDAAGHDWSAFTGVLLVTDSLAAPGDLPRATRAVFDALVPQLYSPDDHYSLSKVSNDGVRLSVPLGRASSRLANVDVRKKGLATPHDRLVVIVLQLDSGRYVAVFSDFPHDGDDAALRAVTASIGSISLQR